MVDKTDKIPFLNSRLRKFSLGGWLILSIIIVLFFIYSIWTQNNSQTTHILELNNTNNFSYLKIEIHKLQPKEPIVNTTISVLTKEKINNINNQVILKIKGDRGYENHLIILPGRRLGDAYYFNNKKNNAPLFPIKGSHAWFPFDNLEFNSSITIDPPLQLAEVELINRVDGFIFSGQPKVEHNGQTILLKFKLKRNTLIQVMAIILALASVLFLILILMIKTIEALSFSVASFFISLWSIRNIIAQGLDTFPSLLDFWMLGLFIILLMGILFKLICWYTRPDISS